MADNSSTKDNKNNNRNPTLRDHERAKGMSGHAVHDAEVLGTSDRNRTGGGGSGSRHIEDDLNDSSRKRHG